MNLFFLQLRGELRKLFARKRSYIGFGAFLVLEMLVLALLQLPRVKESFRRLIESSGYVFEDYFSGLTLAYLILSWTILFLGGLYLALVGGDVVSKEVEDGTMRMMLCRPVSRLRVLLLKYAACFIYTAALISFIAVTAFLAGLLYGGVGGLFVYAPLDGIFALYDFWPGLGRYLAVIPLLTLSLLSITTLGFMFSCFNIKPAAATIVTLSIIFVDSILRNIPYFESLKSWFITARMGVWIRVFEEHIPWMQFVESYAWLAAFNTTFFVIGWLSFELRDLKS